MKKILLVQFIAWTIFTLVDLIEEMFSIDFRFAACLCIPIGVGILYLIRKKLQWDKEKELSFKKKIKQIVIIIFQWSVITLCIASVISLLAIDNKWIVYQYRIGLSHMFNGLEYPIFGCFLLLISIIFVFVSEFLIFLFRKCSSFWKKHRLN